MAELINVIKNFKVYINKKGYETEYDIQIDFSYFNPVVMQYNKDKLVEPCDELVDLILHSYFLSYCEMFLYTPNKILEHFKINDTLIIIMRKRI